jgi:hypothetical protein
MLPDFLGMLSICAALQQCPALGTLQRRMDSPWLLISYCSPASQQKRKDLKFVVLSQVPEDRKVLEQLRWERQVDDVRTPEKRRE